MTQDIDRRDMISHREFAGGAIMPIRSIIGRGFRCERSEARDSLLLIAYSDVLSADQLFSASVRRRRDKNDASIRAGIDITDLSASTPGGDDCDEPPHELSSKCR